ncbi:ROK family transcriptional regulator [Streptomyces sp. NPDC094448]|uniref:ROK family transcriptional regulator n=1 Tax=Streptomyces sp. NPDC094448 TaxID=3366063 RepID=UPI0037FA0280
MAAAAGSRGGANLPVLREHNTALVLALLRSARDHGLSRVGLAARTGLTPQAVSKIVGRLRADGLVAEAGQRASTGGKPRTVLRLVPDARHAVGLQLDRDELTAVLVDLYGRVVAARVTPLDLGAGAGAVVERAAGEVEALLAAGARGRHVLGVGVAMPGPLDHAAGVARRVTRFPEWDGYPLRDAVAARLAMPAVLDKDTNAGALGLGTVRAVFEDQPAAPPALRPGGPPDAVHRKAVGVPPAQPGGDRPGTQGEGLRGSVRAIPATQPGGTTRAAGPGGSAAAVVEGPARSPGQGLGPGPGAGSGDSYAYLHLGTGLGAGLVLDGAVHRGSRTGAGEFGHQVIELDGPECGCGRRGCIEALCLAAVARGDLAGAARILGAGAANLVALLDIDRVLLGGRIIESDRAVAEVFVREVHRSAGVPVALAGGGPHLVARGAAELVLAPLFGGTTPGPLTPAAGT